MVGSEVLRLAGLPRLWSNCPLVRGLPQDTEIVFCRVCWQWHERGDSRCRIAKLRRGWQRVDRAISAIAKGGNLFFRWGFNLSLILFIFLLILDFFGY